MGKKRRAQPVVAVVKSECVRACVALPSERAPTSMPAIVVFFKLKNTPTYPPTGRKKARKIVTTFHKVSSELEALERDKALEAGAREERIKR